MRRPLLIVAAAIVLTPCTLEAQQVDTIRVGSPALRDAALRTGTERIESYRVTGDDRQPTSTTEQTLRRGRAGDRDVYIIRTVHASPDGDTTRSLIVVDASDFRLLHHRVKATHDSAAVTSDGTHVTGWVVLPDTPIRLLDQAVGHAVFPIEGQMPWLFPLLPLNEGYRATIPHFSEWSSGETWSTIGVMGSETVEWNGEGRECWVVDVGEFGPPGYRGTAWVDKETRRILQSALRGPPGRVEYWAYAASP